jgi:hypothetical protein
VQGGRVRRESEGRMSFGLFERGELRPTPVRRMLRMPRPPNDFLGVLSTFGGCERMVGRPMWPRLSEPRYFEPRRSSSTYCEAAEGAETAEAAKPFLLALSWSAHGGLGIRARRPGGMRRLMRAPIALIREGLGMGGLIDCQRAYVRAFTIAGWVAKNKKKFGRNSGQGAGEGSSFADTRSMQRFVEQQGEGVGEH